MPDQSQKTEQPTHHRLIKARREGQFPVSKDLISAVQLALGLALIMNGGRSLGKALVEMMHALLNQAFSPAELTIHGLTRLCGIIFQRPLLLLAEAGFILFGVTLFAQLASTGFGLASKQLVPNVSRLQVGSRLSKMPADNMTATVRAALLLPVIAYLLYQEIESRLVLLSNLSVTNLGAAIAQTTQMIGQLLWRITFVLFLIGAVDYVRRRRQHRQRLRMTKHEIREEAKDMEGNPQMKMRIRRLQRDVARRNMLKALPRATGVIVNPTHYAVALHYELNSRTVPTVVAKGKNYLARLIKEKAVGYGIPIIENQALAQALYKAVDVGQEIPPPLYRAVAEVLAYIYRTLHKGQ
jgi:flagellar biosynthesis protein FlhB